MKKYLFMLSLCIAFALPASFTQAQSKFVYKELKPAVFQKSLQARKGILLDVRTPKEFEAGHLSNATNIDYKNDNFETQLNKLDKTKTYFVYCKSGVRSENAAEIMEELGFTQVYNLDGGIDAWKDEGLPVSKK